MRSRAAIVVLLLFLLAPRTAGAQSRVTVEPYAGVLLTDGDVYPMSPLVVNALVPAVSSSEYRRVGNGLLFGVRLGVEIDDGWRVEGAWGTTSFQVHPRATFGRPTDDPLAEVRIHLWEVTLRRQFGARTLRPFVAFGVGGATSRKKSGDFFDIPGYGDAEDTVPVVVAGVGLLCVVAPRVSIRGGVRDHIHECGDLCGGVETLQDVELSAGAEVTL